MATLHCDKSAGYNNFLTSGQTWFNKSLITPVRESALSFNPKDGFRVRSESDGFAICQSDLPDLSCIVGEPLVALEHFDFPG